MKIFNQSATQMREEPHLIKAKHVIQQHQERVITPKLTDEDVQRIHVRRKYLLADSLRAFSKPTFNLSKMLKITFMGESAVDDGGPRREYFQLLRMHFHRQGFLLAGQIM